jgi:hypothetical protein
MKFTRLTAACLVAGICSVAAADEDWYCKEVATQRFGNVFRSCGVGEGADENAARRAAFENAKKEFGSICAISSDCRGRAIHVQPERTSCAKGTSAGYKCYRLIVFSVGDPVEHPPMALTGNAVGEPAPLPTAAGKSAKNGPTPTPTPLVDPLSAKQIALFEPVDIDDKESFKPFYYRDIAKFPKIRVGMPKAKVLARFGKPSSVRVSSGGTVMVFYRDRSFCDGGRCSFRFDEKTGQVIEFSDFRYEYTEALK